MTTSEQQQREEEEQLHEQVMEFEWKKMVYVPIATEYLAYPVFQQSPVSQKCKMSVFVQGNKEDMTGKKVFLTVHDIGKNHQSFVDFVNSKPMQQLKERAVFLHICITGQEQGAEEFKCNGDFPTVDQFGDGLAQVLAKFDLANCIAIGEGAGADIVCRFAMLHPKLVTGIVLIHCTSTTHGILEHAKEILMNLRLDDGVMNQAAWNYLLTHRFGNHNMDEQQKHFVEHVKNELQLNVTNLSHYIYSFAHRNDFTHDLKDRMARLDTVLVTGGKSAHNDNVQHMFDHMNKTKTSLLVAEDCADLLGEAPEYAASALIFLCQRKGIFPDLELPIGETVIPKLSCSSSVQQNQQPLLHGDWRVKSNFGIFSKCVPMN